MNKISEIITKYNCDNCCNTIYLPHQNITRTPSKIDIILSGVSPSILPTSVGILGFYIFHKLASRRQRKTETYNIYCELKSNIDEICNLSRNCWKVDGASAVASGDIVVLRNKLSRTREDLRLLSEMEKVFEKCKDAFNTLKKTIDEETDQNNLPIHTIDDSTRPPNNEWYQNNIIPRANTLQIQ